MKIERIYQPSDQELKEMIKVWKSSVSATHDFLEVGAIETLVPQVIDGINSVETLLIVKDASTIVAFMGLHDYKIEMLFVDDAQRGKGIGSKLIDRAIHDYDVNFVDVNEQNPKAVGFYNYKGFEVYDRSETDGAGNPYPILHLVRSESDAIVTERLLVRRLKVSDLESLYNIYQTKHVQEFNVLADYDYDEFCERYLEIKHDTLFVIEIRETKEVIGEISFNQDYVRYNVGSVVMSYWMGEKFGKKGYMTEALKACDSVSI